MDEANEAIRAFVGYDGKNFDDLGDAELLRHQATLYTLHVKNTFGRAKDMLRTFPARAQMGAVSVRELAGHTADEQRWASKAALGAAAAGAVYVASKHGHNEGLVEYGAPSIGALLPWKKRESGAVAASHYRPPSGERVRTYFNNLEHGRQRKAVAAMGVLALGLMTFAFAKGELFDGGVQEPKVERPTPAPRPTQTPTPTPPSAEREPKPPPREREEAEREEDKRHGRNQTRGMRRKISIRLDELQGRSDSIWGSSEYQLRKHGAPVSNRAISEVSQAFLKKYSISETQARYLPVGWRGTLVGLEIPQSVRPYIARK